MQGQHQPIIGYVIGGLFAAFILFVRIRRMRGTRPLRLETLWIIPAIFLALTVITLVETPPDGLGWIAAGVALAAGGLLGWHRGRSMRITVDPESGTLTQSASPLTFLLLIAIIVLRVGVRSVAEYELGGSRQVVMLISACFVLLALGLFSVQRLEMFLRARRLLAEVKPATPS